MKKYILIIIASIPGIISGQQFPFMEGYNVNPFSLSPAYAGIHNSRTLFMDHRSDWVGMEGGPATYQLSYNDKVDKVGLGGRFIYDKTDIFKQFLILGTYTYEVNITEGHVLNLGLSAGFFRNSIDLAKYYNNPDYVEDMVLIYGQQKSKIKLATDVSALYRHNRAEAGVLFSNVMFGTVKYGDTDMTYKPLKNYLVHTAYLFDIDDKWSVKPSFIFRGGQNIPAQLEIAPTISWNERLWVTPIYRTGGIFGMGLGAEVYDMIMFNYSYNLSTNVALNIFGSHQLSLGIRILKPRGTNKSMVRSK